MQNIICGDYRCYTIGENLRIRVWSKRQSTLGCMSIIVLLQESYLKGNMEVNHRDTRPSKHLLNELFFMLVTANG